MRITACNDDSGGVGQQLKNAEQVLLTPSAWERDSASSSLAPNPMWQMISGEGPTNFLGASKNA